MTEIHMNGVAGQRLGCSFPKKPHLPILADTLLGMYRTMAEDQQGHSHAMGSMFNLLFWISLIRAKHSANAFNISTIYTPCMEVWIV